MNRMRERRKKKKLTLKQLSEELAKNDLKISADALGKYERGEREPKLDTWQKLADYFNVSVSYLTGVSDQPNVEQNRLRMVRKNKNMSVPELVNAYNKQVDEFSSFNHAEKYMGAEVINSIENGNYQPTDREWQFLAYALTVPKFYLSGKSNDKNGWQEWAEATDYSVEQLQAEIKRLLDTGRLNKNTDIQEQIRYAVESLDGNVPTTTSNTINGVQNRLNDIRRYINSAFLDEKEKPMASGSKIMVIKSEDTSVKKDMDEKAYKQLVDIINNARYEIAKIHSDK